MKKVIVVLCVLILLALACAIPTYAEDITPEQEEQYGFLGEMSLKQNAGLGAFSGQNATISGKLLYGHDCARIDTFGSSYGYVASANIPSRMKCEQARYVVVKYYNPDQIQELGLIWRCQVASAGYNTKNPKMAQLESSGNSWQYLIVDMSDHALWSGTLYNFGFLLYHTGSRLQSIWLQWAKFYSEDPTELYASLDEETLWETEEPITEPPMTEPPMTEPPMTEPPMIEPPMAEPPMAEPPESIAPDEEETAWETFHEQEKPDNNFGGLFFEVFGDDALPGCQGQPLGCKGGGCNAVTGGLLVFCLFASGFVFRKKD